ncbi:hypothetical protein GZH47_21730 [Paenibacillus rhizovicinus]|uniref:TATA-box binding protein n=2 Tax=Paenibacillus rhizovicinus TaxID=2704463 RepID=A0A6C0P4G3_9BACL|nr:hypothetical protein GZH47_21730 [Paenibacillus rhizovicinus]
MAEKSLELTPIRSMKRKRFPQAGIFAALLILIGAVVWAVASGKNGQHSDSGALRPLSSDFESVWSWSDSEFAGGARSAQWTFRWDGAVSLQAAKAFAAGLGFHLSGQLSDSSPIDVVASDAAYKMTLWLHSRQASEDETGDNTDTGTDASGLTAEKPLYDIVLLMNASEDAEKQAMSTAIKQVEESIAHAGLPLRGGLTVKGNAAGDGAGARVAKAASAKETETYDDGHTSSLTYFSDKLASKVQSGEKTVNLQIAESVSGTGKVPELIIGVPLITGDYAMQEK